MKTIPRFSSEDTGEIESLFRKKGIPCETESVHIYAGSYGAGVEYLFYVPNDYYSSAIEVIKNYYGLNQDQDNDQDLEYCPACNSKILNPKECSECGLSFSYTPEESMKEHPFYIYLKQESGGESGG